MITVTFRENVTLIEVKGEISNEGTLTKGFISKGICRWQT